MKTLVNLRWPLALVIFLGLQACNLEKIAEDAPPVADFTIGNNGCTASCIVTFDASSSENATSYNWDFGDGNLGSGVNASHTYDNPGEYTVTLTVGGAGGSEDMTTDIVNIVQDSTLRACFMIDSSTCQGFAPVEIFITNCSQFATTFSWVWGDGTASQQENPGSHLFENPGVYTITLSVEDGKGNMDDTTINFTVLAPNTFTQNYGLPQNYDEGWGLTSTSDGNFVIAGYSSDTLATGVNATAYLRKINADGQELWKRNYPGTKVTAYQEVIETSDGGIAAVGLKSDNDTLLSRYDLLFVKTDADGNTLVDRTFGDQENSEWGFDLTEATDGNFYAITYKRKSGGSTFHPWIVKIDRNGNQLWAKFFGDNDTKSNFGQSIIGMPGGGFAFIGNKDNPGGTDNDLWLYIGDADGNLVNEKLFGIPGESENGTDLIRTPDGGFALLGDTRAKGAGSSDVWLIRTDANANLIWDFPYGFTGFESGDALLIDRDGNFVLLSGTSEKGAGSTDLWVIKTDGNGAMIWDEPFGGPRFDNGYNIVETNDCGYAAIGTFDAPSGQNNEQFFVKMDNDGQVN